MKSYLLHSLPKSPDVHYLPENHYHWEIASAQTWLILEISQLRLLVSLVGFKSNSENFQKIAISFNFLSFSIFDRKSSRQANFKPDCVVGADAMQWNVCDLKSGAFSNSWNFRRKISRYWHKNGIISARPRNRARHLCVSVIFDKNRITKKIHEISIFW